MPLMKPASQKRLALCRPRVDRPVSEGWTVHRSVEITEGEPRSSGYPLASGSWTRRLPPSGSEAAAWRYWGAWPSEVAGVSPAAAGESAAAGEKVGPPQGPLKAPGRS